jgi:hypothetical protein
MLEIMLDIMLDIVLNILNDDCTADPEGGPDSWEGWLVLTKFKFQIKKGEVV